MELIVYEKLKLAQKPSYIRTELEDKVLTIMHSCCFTTMIVDEDNQVLFKNHKDEIFSIQEFRKGTTTRMLWEPIQKLWDKEVAEYSKMKPQDVKEILRDFRRCFDVAQHLDSMYPELPGAFSGTVSERLERHLERIKLEGLK